MPIGTRRAASRKAVRSRNWRKPPLYIKQILAWADAHHEETGRWPRSDSGRVRGTLEEKWHLVDNSLRLGQRGLPGGDSLARLLARYRGVRNRKALPPYTLPQILGWADAYFKEHGAWPIDSSGSIAEAPGETWLAVDMALRHPQRGLPGGSSLARLLAEHRGKRNVGGLPSFKLSEILKWADAYQKRTGMWPTLLSGSVPDVPGETWLAVDKALRNGTRGMRGGSSLARMLKRHRGVPLKLRRRPALSMDMVLAWADEHRDRTGQWPRVDSGEIPAAPGETWHKVQNALHAGKRGLKGGSSLARLWAEHRGARYHLDLPGLTVKQILAWADAYFERHGRWPGHHGGPIDDAPHETWTAVGLALARGKRGLPGGASLARLLAERRGVRNHGDLPKFNTARILAWVDAHYRRTGMWPTDHSGPIAEMPDESWAIVDRALRRGYRGFRGGSSLARLLNARRGVKPKQRRKPRLTLEMILEWADDYHAGHGHWPTQASGKIPQSAGDTWGIIDVALRHAARGLPAGWSLGKLWAVQRGARNVHSIPKFSAAQILRWADAHRRRTGQWPRVLSGPIAESPTDNWLSVDNALRLGLRGMPGGSSLKRFLDKHRKRA